MIVKQMSIIRKTVIKIKIVKIGKGIDMTRFRSCPLQRRSIWRNPSMNLISLTVKTALQVIDFFLTM